jgi:hypothetical protein
MRVFLRLPYEAVFPTYDVDEDATVGELKRLIHESRQAEGIDLETMRLFVAGVQLEHDALSLGLCVPPTSANPQLLHVVLRGRTRACSWCTSNWKARSPDGAVTMTLPGLSPVQAQPLVTVEVRDAHETLVPGVTKVLGRANPATVPEPGCDALVQWVPRACLLPATRYTVYVTGAVECAWAWETEAATPIRVRVAMDGGAPRIVRLDRSGALLAELHTRVLARFQLSSATHTVAELSGERTGAIENDTAVRNLVEFEILSFRVAARPAQPAPVVVPTAALAADAAAYRASHWVNPRAGFYALCGKMTPEHETAALLEIVRVFTDDTSVARALPRAPTGAASSAAAVHRLPRKRARASCGCNVDPTLAVIPPELIKPLWDAGGQPFSRCDCLIFDEDVLHKAAAEWMGG